MRTIARTVRRRPHRSDRVTHHYPLVVELVGRLDKKLPTIHAVVKNVVWVGSVPRCCMILRRHGIEHIDDLKEDLQQALASV